MEKDFIRWLVKQSQIQTADVNSATAAEVVLGIGDDGAIIRSHDDTVWVTDTIVDKVHFDLQKDSLARIGRKSLAVNLSDLAAMGAVPHSALLTLVLPKSFSVNQAKELFGGVNELAAEYGVVIVGGDTNRHDGPLMVGIAAMGNMVPGSKSTSGWRLDGAKLDDQIFVTGPLGGSLLGKHFDFQPRVELAGCLAKMCVINSATDISDSLTVDLEHLISASAASSGGELGAEIEMAKVPVSDAASEMARSSGKSALDHALYDGEDFELLITMSQEESDRAMADDSVNDSLYRIGRVVASSGLVAVSDGEKNVLAPRGYEH